LWSQSSEGKTSEEYNIKIDLEKIRKEVKEQNIQFCFWKDKETNEPWISKNIDSFERWVQYKGSIEELQKWLW
jgi:hypothetical protein